MHRNTPYYDWGIMALWMDRDDHLARHGVTIEQAEEALLDPGCVVLDPDPAARPGGRGVRTVGYSRSAAGVLCVITVTEGGITYGATAFRANITYQRIYREANNG
jgi:uncharacterized DUF497 family protein